MKKGAVFFLTFFFFCGCYFLLTGYTEEETILEEEITKQATTIPKKAEIKGSVVTPGVYEIKENDRVQDMITYAGGLLENANTDKINLSKIVTDEMVIIVYSNEEIAAFETSKIKYEIIEIPCECPDTLNNACIEEKSESTNTKINLNTATLEELMTLSNVGESKAKNIIAYRESFPFESIEQLKEVSGIGEALFDKIKDDITV